MKKLIHIDDCGLEATVDEYGWVIVMDENGNNFSLGKYPNKRFRIIEKAISDSKFLEQEDLECQE